MGAMCLSQAWLCLLALANSMQDLFFFFLSFFVIVWFLVFQDIVGGGGVGHEMLPPGITALRWGKVSRLKAARRKGCQLRQGACQGPAVFLRWHILPPQDPPSWPPTSVSSRPPCDSAMYQQVTLGTEQTLDKWSVLLTLFTLPVFTCSRETQEIRERESCGSIQHTRLPLLLRGVRPHTLHVGTPHAHLSPLRKAPGGCFFSSGSDNLMLF